MPGKILIIGRGIAGSILSLRLHEKGIKHDIIDLPALSASSRVAAGVVNPIVLKRLKLVKNAPEFLEESGLFYPEWESRTQTSFYHDTPIKHILQNPGEANLWMERSANPDYAPYLGPIISEEHAHLNTKAGIGIVEQAGWLDTQTFLDEHLTFHKFRGGFSEEQVSPADLKELEKTYDKVIISTGHLMRELTPKTNDAFAPTRGELMLIWSQDLPEDAIYHGPVFILPLGSGRYRVGATYHWDNLEDTPSEEGLARLKSELKKIFSGSYEVLGNQAGVRPNVKDRKPLLGQIRGNIYSFNGMGSRGVLMAPYLAKVFLEFLFDGAELPAAYDIKRYTTT